MLSEPLLVDRTPAPGPPVVDGLVFDAHRLANTPRAALDDDAWFEVFVVADGRVAIVCGERGVRGAADVFTRNLRELFAGGAGGATLNGARAPLSRYCAAASATALVGLIDVERQTLTYISTGHPPPFIRFAGGVIARPPADPSRAASFPAGQVRVDLRGAQCVLVATRGVIDAGGGDVAGLDRLAHVLSDDRLPLGWGAAAWIARNGVAESACGGALLALIPHSWPIPPAGPATAVPGWTITWKFDATAAASHAARRAFLACLAPTIPGRASIDVAAAELIFGELLGNVVRHAPGPVEVELSWTAELPVLHVRDTGPGFRSRRRRERLPIDDLSESGRGLFIISSFSAGFSVRNRPGRGTHAMATLPALT